MNEKDYLDHVDFVIANGIYSDIRRVSPHLRYMHGFVIPDNVLTMERNIHFSLMRTAFIF